jgi:hypothetical protein
MSHYTIDELIARWKREELTAEQVIGQILLLLKEHERRIREAAKGAAAETTPAAKP